MENIDKIKDIVLKSGRVIKRSKEGHDEFKSGIRRENLIRHCYNDLLNGATYSILKEKIMNDEYEVGHKYSGTQAERIIYAARKLVQDDFREQVPSLIEDAYMRMLDVYSECRSEKDRANAIKALDNINKLAGLYEEKIRVEGNVNQTINIDFGFNNDDEEE